MKHLLLLLFVSPVFTKAQKPKINHPTILGARFTLLDFSSSNLFRKATGMVPALGFSFLKGVGNHFDWYLSVDGCFTDSATDTKLLNKKLLIQPEFGLRARMFTTSKAFQPFLSAGTGATLYNENFSAYLSYGMGIQLKLFPDAFLIVQTQRRLTVPEIVNNHFFYSIGFSGTINPGARKAASSKKIPIHSPSIRAMDRDMDGILDSVDACPDIPGMAIFEGCPDRDADGIQDSKDSCPDVFGLKKYEGCPIPDTDKDGINNEEDSCITVFGIARYKGCPVPDKDNDATPDEEDRCPDLAGSLNNNGCPEIKKEITSTINKATRNILFVTGSYQLLKISQRPLEEVIEILKSDTSIIVSIEGHTDNIGTISKNQLLSEQRAASVMRYLINKGINKERLRSSGFGQTMPLVSNDSKAGRKVNRRVEMKLAY